jgi:hypothetical protein
MRDNPFLGQYTIKSQAIRKWRGKMMENGKYGQGTIQWLIKGVPISKPIPKENHLLGHNFNHQGEEGKKA